MSHPEPIILVVEDNEQNLELTEFLLEEAGAKLLSARNAEEMRLRLQEMIPDLVLMDIQLPGTDGLLLAQEIRTSPQTKDVPVVALTAHAMRGDRERFLAAGCVGYIPKPIEVGSFVEKVFSFLERPGISSDSGGA